MNGQHQTYIFVIHQIVEVRAQDRAHAEEVLRAYPPTRRFNGCGFSIRTRQDIEIREPAKEAA